jgi:hypothetical protein
MIKKILLFFAAVGIVTALNAQEYKTCMGLRAGLPTGITAKHFLNKTYAVEGVLATRWGGFVLTGFFEREYWTGEYPGFNWFWGGGAHIGFWDAGYNPRIDDDYAGPVFGIDAIGGIEYTFDELPLNLSFDLMPSLNLIGSTGWGGINGALSIRYVF